MNKKQA